MINITKLFVQVWEDTACTCELHDATCAAMIQFQLKDNPSQIKLASYFKVPNSHTEHDK